ncbi:hypothetical protein D0Z06_19540 [Geodermatophilus marinus]|nr:hypothetical protein D0Z06_19540 [Geodermatophilus sp. LHW52908]
MGTAARVGAFALALLTVLGVAWGVGAAVGPVGPASAGDPPAHGQDAPAGSGPAAGGPDAGPPAGLQVSDGGYTLALDGPVLPAGPGTPLSFRVLGPDGAPVTAYEEEHGEDLHLVAVRRDLTGYQHVHPERDAEGTWTAPLDLAPGSWRVLADLTTGGAGRVLGADLAVPGEFAPEPLPAPAATAEVDGYTVVLTGDLAAGQESELTLGISRDGVPVTDLQPYLGAYGHLVALRDGDLGYLHVHPAGDDGVAPAPGPHVEFATRPPSPGTYRLFLDFRHGDAVRTAAFTVEVPAGAAPAGATAPHGHGTTAEEAHG